MILALTPFTVPQIIILALILVIAAGCAVYGVYEQRRIISAEERRIRALPPLSNGRKPQ